MRSQDSVSVICAVAGSVTNPKSADITWTFVKDNWDLLYSRYSQGFLITRLVKVRIFFSIFSYYKAQYFLN